MDRFRIARHRPTQTQIEFAKISPRRLKTVLQILDSSLAGATHREIAMAVYGRDRVDAQWDDPGEHLKDHIRKTIRRGHRLMTGRYCVFLA